MKDQTEAPATVPRETFLVCNKQTPCSKTGNAYCNCEAPEEVNPLPEELRPESLLYILRQRATESK